MKHLFVICLLLFSFSCQQDNSPIKEIKEGKVHLNSGKSIAIQSYDDPEAVIFFIVRHAEKESVAAEQGDPNLSEAGRARAERLATIMTGVPLGLVTSTNYHRTTQTANPTVLDKRCDISTYNPGDMPDHFGSILEERKGQKVMVIGHSNSVPELLNLFIGQTVYNDIPDSEYSRFYIASVKEMGQAEIAEFSF